MTVSEMIYNQKRKVVVPTPMPSEALRQGMDAQELDEELFSQTDKRRGPCISYFEGMVFDNKRRTK